MHTYTYNPPSPLSAAHMCRVLHISGATSSAKNASYSLRDYRLQERTSSESGVSFMEGPGIEPRPLCLHSLCSLNCPTLPKCFHIGPLKKTMDPPQIHVCGWQKWQGLYKPQPVPEKQCLKSMAELQESSI